MTLKIKAAVGSVLPTGPGTTYHSRSIPEGYARVMVNQITDIFEDLQLDHPTGEGEIRLGSSLKTPCLWRKELINLPNWTPPPPPPPPASQGNPPPPPASDQGTQPPSPARGGTPPPSAPAPARPSSQPPPSPPRQQVRINRPTAAPAAPPARCSPSPPPRKKGKTAAAAPSTPASSSTARGGRQYKFGPSLKIPKKYHARGPRRRTPRSREPKWMTGFKG